MSKKKDLTNKKFGSLTVLKKCGINNEGRVIWLCHCDCGEEREVTGKSLLQKKVTRCKKKCTLTEDLSGKTFGFLKVIRRAGSDKHGFARFFCRCINLVDHIDYHINGQKHNIFKKCGNDIYVNGIALRSSLKQKRKIPKCCASCSRKLAGKLRTEKNLPDLTGQTFGRLTVIHKIIRGEGRQKRTLWKCFCSCGSKRKTYVRTESLIGKSVRPIRSCGCLQREYARANTNNFIHGLSDHPLYCVWANIKARTENSKNTAFVRYGARGIVFCKNWKDPANFIKWALENGWAKGLHIDRIDNEKGYSPENCQFITPLENTMKRHKDAGHATFYKGKQLNIRELSRKTGVYWGSIKKLINAGYSIEDLYLYSRLSLSQKRKVTKSIKIGPPITIKADQLLKIKKSKLTHSYEINSYRAMIARCYNSNNPSYRWYRAKGIGVCEEWRQNSRKFLEDMGPRPFPKHDYALDRIDPKADYVKENCRWITKSANSRRRKKVRSKLKFT